MGFIPQKHKGSSGTPMNSECQHPSQPGKNRFPILEKKKRDQFLEPYKLPGLNHKEKENLNRMVLMQGDFNSNQKPPDHKRPEQGGFAGEFYQHPKKI